MLEGYAKVSRGGRTITRLGPGDFFGDTAMLDGRPRTASVVADGPVRCLRLALARRRTLGGRSIADSIARRDDADPACSPHVLRVAVRREQVSTGTAAAEVRGKGEALMRDRSFQVELAQQPLSRRDGHRIER